MMKSTWSPFQSPEVRAICKNLTDDESATLTADARCRCTEIARCFGVPLAWVVSLMFYIWMVLGPPVVYQALATLIVLASFITYFITCVVPRLVTMRRRVRGILCDSEFAKQQGYDPSDLRLESLPWQGNGAA